MIPDIILIGPIGTGKSTLGKLLSLSLEVPQVSMDDVRLIYYEQIGFDLDLAKRIKVEKGFLKLYQYWKPFEAYAVERLLAEHRHCVIDFGAGHSVFEDDLLFARVQRVLQPYCFKVSIILYSSLYFYGIKIYGRIHRVLEGLTYNAIERPAKITP